MPPRSTDRDDWKPQKGSGEILLRKVKRRLKAAASIGLAIAAGTFLAFQKSEAKPRRPKVPPNPTTPEVSDLPSPPPPDGGAPPTNVVARVPDWKLEECGTEKQKNKAAKGDQIKKPGTREKVDREEHRKGMPVPDNLLE